MRIFSNVAVRARWPVNWYGPQGEAPKDHIGYEIRRLAHWATFKFMANVPALPPKADIRDEGRNVYFVQIPKVLNLVVEGRARSIVRAFIRKDIAPIQWFRSGKNQIFGRK
jgi:hypothetical protein